MVEGQGGLSDALLGDEIEIGFAWEGASQSADGVFDTALLPGGVGVAEESLDAELVVECELGAVVEGEAFPEVLGDGIEEPGEVLFGAGGGSIGWVCDKGVAGLPFVEDEERLTRSGEEHVVGFPMTWGLPVGCFFGAFCDGASMADEAGGASATDAELASAGFAAWQKAMPVILVGGAMVDVAID